MRTLGLDPGSRRIGVALSDTEGRVAVPLEIVPRGAGDQHLHRLAQIVAERGVTRIVMGSPLTLRGEAGPAAANVTELVEALRRAVPVEVVLWDERFSTAAVERDWQQAGVSSRQRRGRTDAAAAALILQSYLEAHEQD
jgi:putative Holliday junction resolvase